MTPSTLAFAILAALTLAGGLGVVTARNVVHAALCLLLCMAAAAGVFILLLADFLALVQILIYGGAVTIVLLFALMLTRIEEFSRVKDNPQLPLAIVAGLATLGVLVAAFVKAKPQVQALERVGFGALGNELFTRWAIPFEVASLVLLVALIGAIVIARTSEREEQDTGQSQGQRGEKP